MIFIQDVEIMFDGIFRALGYLLIAGVVYYVWKIASEQAGGGKYIAVLWKGFLFCVGIALFASLTLGDPSCEIQSDPLYGDCEQYADNGFDVTTEQRMANFSYFMTLLYIPVVIGALKKR